VYPVLADNVFEHTSPFTAPQSVQIKLPEGVTCTHCVLQVIEFMADHGLNNPGGCFYHHCADISISADGGLDDDGGAPPDGGSLASGTSGASGSGGNTPASSSSTSSRVGSGSVGTGAGGERGSNGPASVSGAGGGASGASSSKGCSCSVPATEERVVVNLAAIVGVALLAASRRRARG
jgi:MYXO-CTERM domain-containing protein